MALDLTTDPVPAADHETAAALIVDTRRLTVGLTGRIAAVAARAAGTGREFQLVTRSDAAVTVALDDLLRHGTWVRHDGPGFRDGRTGAPLRWTGERFVACGPPPRPEPSDPGRGGAQVQLTRTHDARTPAGEGTIGAAAAAVLSALTGAGPTGWGPAEPVGQPWTVREVDRYCRRRAPDPSALVVVGDGALGTLHVTATTVGLVERLHVPGPPADRVTTHALDVLAADLAAVADTMVVSLQPGVTGGRRDPGPLPPAVPIRLLVGADVVAARGATHALAAPAEARLLGPACWCRLTGTDRDPLAVLADVLAHFGGLPDPP